MIDLVFANLITRGGSRPMSIYQGANIVLVHLLIISPPHETRYRTSRRPLIAFNQLIMPNWMPSLYPGGSARLIPRRTSFNAFRRSAGSEARYSVTVDAGMGQVYHEGFCRGNRNVRIHAEARKCAYQGHGAACARRARGATGGKILLSSYIINSKL